TRRNRRRARRPGGRRRPGVLAGPPRGEESRKAMRRPVPRIVEDPASVPPVRADAEAGGPVVAVRSLTKRYGDVVAVDDVTVALLAGTITGFLGPNGAGKTTTLRLLLRL